MFLAVLILAFFALGSIVGAIGALCYLGGREDLAYTLAGVITVLCLCIAAGQNSTVARDLISPMIFGNIVGGLGVVVFFSLTD